MQAIILAGGKGTRLQPYTTVLPKPLVPVGGLPILEIIVRQLRRHGVTDIVLAVNHLADLIEAFFGDGSKWGVNITYSREHEPVGTAAPIALVERLAENFIVMNGDVLTTIDYTELTREHARCDAIATLSTCAKPVPISLGVIEANAEGRLTGYVEKPTLSFPVSMGIYVLNRRVLQHIPKGEHLDFPDLMLRLIAAGEHVHCYPFTGEWYDIGRPEDFEHANEQFVRNVHSFLGAAEVTIPLP